MTLFTYYFSAITTLLLPFTSDFVYLLLFFNYYFSSITTFLLLTTFTLSTIFTLTYYFPPFTPCTTQFPLSSDLLDNYRCVSELY